MAAELPELVVADAAAWRAWLAEHHGDPAGVWLVLAKKGTTEPTSLTYAEALDEALCFGWIDGLARRHDEGSWRQRFTPRGPRSAWSTINREIVERLTREGRMTPAGQAVIDAAKANGMWTLLADAQAGVVPDDLKAALDADPAAAAGWEAMRPSARRACLEALARAKRADTRRRRVDDAMTAARRAGGGGRADVPLDPCGRSVGTLLLSRGCR